MAVREYRLSVDADELLDKVFEALRRGTVVEDIVGEEIADEPDDGRGAQARRFRLLPDTIQRGDAFDIFAQDELTGEWLSVTVGDCIVLRTISRE